MQNYAIFQVLFSIFNYKYAIRYFIHINENNIKVSLLYEIIKKKKKLHSKPHKIWFESKCYKSVTKHTFINIAFYI